MFVAILGRVRLRFVLVAALAVACAILAAAPAAPARAAGPITRTWTGAGANSLWTNNANWNPAAPNEGDILVFPQAAARKANTNDFPAFTSFESITFTGSGYAVSGNRVDVSEEVFNHPPSGSNTVFLVLDGEARIRNTAGTLNLMAQNSHAGATLVEGGHVHAGSNVAFGEFDAVVELAGGSISLGDGVTVFNALTVGGPAAPGVAAETEAEWAGDITLTGEAEFDAPPGGELALSGSVSGSGPLVKTGPGQLALSAENTYMGITEVTLGTLRITRADALGTAAAGTEVQPGSSLVLGPGVQLSGEQVSIAGSGEAGLGALRNENGVNTIAHLQLAGDSTIHVPAGVLRLNGGLQGPAEATVTKSGPGRLDVFGEGPFAGTIRVAAGELSIRSTVLADIALEVGILSGDNYIEGDVSATSGVIEPGWDGFGGLTLLGDLTVGPAVTMRFAIEGAGAYTRLYAHEAVTLLSPTLELVGEPALAAGDEVVLIQNFGLQLVEGSFAGLPDRAVLPFAGGSFRVLYGAGPQPGNDIALVALDGVEPIETRLIVVPPFAIAPTGSELTVAYRVSNEGPGEVGGATVAIPIGPGMTYDYYEASAAWTCLEPPAGGGVLICSREPWAAAPGMFEVIELHVKVTGVPGATLTFSGSLQHNGLEADDTDNFPSVSVAVGGADPRPFKLRVPWAARDGTN